MTDETWRADVERIIAWTQADARFLERAGARFGPDERAALAAVVETHGDPTALAERLAPVVLARLRARSAASPKLRRPAEVALKAVDSALVKAWSPPDAQQVAEAFTQRYATSIAALTGATSAAAAKASALATAVKSVSGSKAVMEAADALRAQASELQAVAHACTHPEDDKTRWLDHARETTREAADVAAAVKTLRKQVSALGVQAKQIAAALTAWAEAPEPERAATAEAMATRVRAAADAAAAMASDFTADVLGRPQE